ncbi:phospholipase B1, membrane-associated [Strongylocentrotus purpuratus]|uniref:Phospholipase B1, membrane-associated n=1 Tax=Strongylocentrotus purpuratus TaxID=7668 RepID=A0A7M7PR00_STRPU|nr:phospholipase B1, membrane-associated [Strongylocentrotus purpuratus]
MARIVTTFAAILTALAHLQLSNFNVYADNKFMQAYSKLVSDLEIMVDWNETLELLPGFECYEERPLDLPPLGKELTFPCEDLPPSDEIPTSAHRLRPGDIKAIGAMGDSLTAANGAGACFLPELLYMYRGLTFSHGGDESFETNPTLANILRKYNPDLKGYGVNTGMWDTKDASLNVGHPGDIAADMPHQADWLVAKMKADPEIDYENDWKIVTLFIGGNDLCDWCKNNEYYSPENYVKHIHEALMILHDQMPRTIVNVIGTIRVSEVEKLRGPICDIFQWAFCSCALFLTPDERANFDNLTKVYQVMLEESITNGQYDDKEDFTVVLQPFLHDTVVPLTESGDPDFSYFAPDCFHLSAKGHAQGGLELWKNMMEPVGAKATSWSPDKIDLTCPSQEFQYIYTNVNSRPEFWEPTQPATTSASTRTMDAGVVSMITVALATLILAARH